MRAQHTNFDEFFHIVSRLIIIFPIIIVVTAVFIKLTSRSTQQKGFVKKQLTPTPTKTQNLLDKLKPDKKSTDSAKFNLTGPLICSFDSQNSKVKAYIKDKKISLIVEKKDETDNFLLTGDCLYNWDEGSYSGEKICGISEKVNILEGLLSSGLVDINFLFKSLNQIMSINPTEKSGDSFQSILNSCENKPIPENIRFSLPKNILFKNKILE